MVLTNFWRSILLNKGAITFHQGSAGGGKASNSVVTGAGSKRERKKHHFSNAVREMADYRPKILQLLSRQLSEPSSRN